MRVRVVRPTSLTGSALVTALTAIRHAYPTAQITVQVEGRPLPPADLVIRLDSQGQAITERETRALPLITHIPQPKKSGG